MPEYRHTFDRPDCVLLSVNGTFCVPFCRSARLSALSALVFLRSAFSVSAFCAFLLSAIFYYEKGKNAMAKQENKTGELSAIAKKNILEIIDNLEKLNAQCTKTEDAAFCAGYERALKNLRFIVSAN